MAAVLVLLAASTSPLASAATQLITPAEPPVRVTLRIAAETHTFHAGELIPLEMVFTAGGPNYGVVFADTRRDGRRIDSDQLHLVPATGFSDPLEAYLNVLPQSSWGDPIGSEGLNAGQPRPAEFNLNGWRRFDVPGHYRLSIESKRVSSWSAKGVWLGIVPVVTNEVEFDVAPADPVWQAQQMKEIVYLLDHTPARPDDELDPAVLNAIARLRYLDTPESTRELARRLRGENLRIDRECLQGLLTSPAREVAVAEVDRLLAQPGFPVSERFLDARCWLKVKPGPEPYAQSGTEYQRVMASSRQLLGGQLEKKTGYGLAVSLNTLLESPRRPQNEPLAPELRAKLIQVFPLLPRRNQSDWLSRHWMRVAGPDWIDVLRYLSTRSIGQRDRGDSEAQGLLGVSGLALQRWYELDPAGARPVVVAEIARPESNFEAGQLSFLPDATLPEAQKAIAHHLAAATGAAGQRRLSALLARYADGSVGSTVLPMLDGGLAQLDCAVRTNILAWFLKTRPVGESSLLERVSAGCGTTLFSQIGGIVEHEAVERLAVRAMDDPDLNTVVEALRYIRDHGSASSERPVWERLLRWNEQWHERLAELELVDLHHDPHSWDRVLGMELVQVLARGRGWLADEARLRQILAVTLDKNGRSDVESCLFELNLRPRKIAVFSGLFTVGCNQLQSLPALKDKLLQFPPGASFVWTDGRIPGSSPTPGALARDLAEWGAAHGRPIEPAPPRRMQ